jgi:hypothetical protein
MAVGDFTGKKPRLTYDSLIHVESNEPLNLGYQYLTDGLGNRSTIELSTTAVKINNVTLNGTVILGSPLELSNGGLGASLSAPGSDRILFWDDSEGSTAFLELGTNLSITGTTLNATGGGGGGITDGDYGDITVSGGATIWTIDSAAVTYDKIQDISATSKFLGRKTAGAGVVEELSASDAKTILSISYTDVSGLGTLATQSGTFSGTSSGTNTGDQNLFSTVSVSGQSDVVADSTTDTLTLVAGSNVTITTDAATDTITIAATSGGGVTDHGALTGLADDDHAQYHNDSRADTWLATKTTTNLTEGTNLYYTSGRFDTAFATKTTADLTELTNLYYTNTRADARIAAAVGVSVQAYDATLTAFAAYNTNGILTQTAADTFTGRTITGTANQITVTNGDGVAGNPTVSIPYNLNLGSSSTAQSSITFFEDTDNGSNKITLTTPASIAADYTFTLPPDVGTSGYVLRTDGSGTTTWVAQSGGGGSAGTIFGLNRVFNR